jgi:Spy/CpxP family protein refolding chaperone
MFPSFNESRPDYPAMQRQGVKYMIFRFSIIWATAALGLALAQPPGHMGAGMGPGGPGVMTFAIQGGGFDALKAYFALTDAQVQSLTSIQQQQQQAVKGVFEQIQTKETSLHDLLDKGGADAATVGKLVMDIDTLRKQAQTAGAGFGDQAKALLTADQKTKLAALGDTAQLMPAIHEAMMLGLVAPPAPPNGVGPGNAIFMMRTPGPGADVLMPASGTSEKRVMYFRHEK